MTKQTYLTTERVELTFELPLAEIVFDFYDRLKSISRGYASFDYAPKDYRSSDLVKLDILLNSEPVDALSALVHRDKAATFGRKICKTPEGTLATSTISHCHSGFHRSKNYCQRNHFSPQEGCNSKMLWR